MNRKIRSGGLFLGLVATVAACLSYPDESERLNDTLVATRRDSAATFSADETFAIRADISVMELADSSSTSSSATASPEPVRTLTEQEAAPLVDAVRQNMVRRGFREVDRAARPDLGIQMAVLRKQKVSETRLAYLYGGYGGYSGYGVYNGEYWGYAGVPYYAPWNYVPSTWTSGGFVVELFRLPKDAARDQLSVADAGGALVARDGGAGGTPIQAVWYALVYGVLADSNLDDAQRVVTGINQAFAQSPYLTR